MSVVLNNAYYNQLAACVRQASPEMFTHLLNQHKQDLEQAGFEKPAEALANSIKWLAARIITTESNSYKKPDDITDTDLAKLEVLRTKEGFDYFREIKIFYNQECSYGGNRSLSFEYNMPLFIYLANKKNDLTDYQTTVYQEAIARVDKMHLDWHYAISAKQHLSQKNILHVLLEGELQPNKKKIADTVFPRLAGKGYEEFVMRQHWEGPSTGRDCFNTFYSTRYPLHSAVRSGRLENVQYAVEQGEVMHTNYNNYDRSPFAEATNRITNAGYREIAIYLLGVALEKENGVKLLTESYGTSHGSSYPIRDFAQAGDLDIVTALAQADVGIPVLQGHIWKDKYIHVTACGAHVGASKTEYTVSDTGKREMVSSIEHAVFNLDPKRGYQGYQDIFGKAVAFLIENNALNESDVPEKSLADPRYLNFVYSLRRVAEEVQSRDPSFLRDTAVFTQDFADTVKAAKADTMNFTTVYGDRDKTERAIPVKAQRPSPV